MVSKLFPVLAGCLFISKAFAISLGGIIPNDPESEAQAVERIEKIDPLENSSPTKSPPDETFEGNRYKTISVAGGLQLHPSCQLEASRSGITTQKFQEMMDSFMRTMLDRMIKCVDSYPELKGYVSESISHYRRQVIKCEPPPGKKGLIKPLKMNVDYWAYNSQGNIAISNDMLEALTKNSKNRRDKAIASIFHEILHSTHCNNRHDHNDVERKPAAQFKHNKNCDENVTMDRISVVEGLCMGSHLNSSEDPAALIISSRINMCNTDRGCRDMFTAKGNNIDWWEQHFNGAPPTRDISEADATKLCQRIKDDGMCLHDRRTQGKTITKANQKVRDAQKHMKERLDKILPGTTNQVPQELLALYPELEQRFDAIKNGPCTQKHMVISSKEPFEANFRRTEVKTVSSGSWAVSGKRTLAGHISTISNDLSAFLKKFPRNEECRKDEDELSSVISELGKKLQDSKSLNQLPLLVDLNEKLEYPQSRALRDPNSDLVKLLGKTFVSDYLKVMDSLHYRSPHFDCVAAGLAPFRALEAANKPSAHCE